MCSIQNCGEKPVAKGFCAKHYMRARRTGDAAKTRKPGRTPGPYSALVCDELSPRTQARYIRAMRILHEIGADPIVAIKDATRPNGSVNVSKFANLADRELLRFLIETRDTRAAD
jgi:hypothetical protein